MRCGRWETIEFRSSIADKSALTSSRASERCASARGRLIYKYLRVYASIRVINNANNASALFEIFQCRICRTCRCRRADVWEPETPEIEIALHREASCRRGGAFCCDIPEPRNDRRSVVSDLAIFLIISLLFRVEKTTPDKRSSVRHRRLAWHSVNAKSVNAKYLQAAITFALRRHRLAHHNCAREYLNRLITFAPHLITNCA